MTKGLESLIYVIYEVRLKELDLFSWRKEYSEGTASLPLLTLTEVFLQIYIIEAPAENTTEVNSAIGMTVTFISPSQCLDAHLTWSMNTHLDLLTSI